MTIKIEEDFVKIPTSASVLTGQYYHYSSYTGDQIAANNNGNINLSKGPVIASGCFCTSDGTNTGTSMDSDFDDSTGYHIRGRAFIPKPYNKVSYCLVASGSTASALVRIRLSDFQFTEAYGSDEQNRSILTEIDVSATADISDTSNSRYSGSIISPVAPDRMIYYYINANAFARLASFCFYGVL